MIPEYTLDCGIDEDDEDEDEEEDEEDDDDEEEEEVEEEETGASFLSTDDVVFALTTGFNFEG